MSSEHKSTATTTSTGHRQRRSLLDHIVDSVANMAPHIERETSTEVHGTKADNDSSHHHSDAFDNVSSLTASIKHSELQDLRAEQASASSSFSKFTSSFSSSWSITRSHLLVGEEILSHLESEMMEQEDIAYETQKEDEHDPFAKDDSFSVDKDGLITLSSLLSEDEEAGAGSGSFKKTWMNRAA